MSFSQIKSEYVEGGNFSRYTQGAILENIVLLEKGSLTKEELEVIDKELPYTVILTQDCDLEQDYNARRNARRKDEDKFLPSILLCPAYHAEKVRQGTHLEEQELRMSRLNSDLYRTIKNNNNPRYHFLGAHEELQVPELIMDFKHYYTLSTEMLYKLNKQESHLVSISELFREKLAQRFAQYISRIALPELT